MSTPERADGRCHTGACHDIYAMVCDVAGHAWDDAAISLHARFLAGEISPDEMVAALPPIWRSRSDFDPLNSAASWRAMVDYAGYFTWASGQAAGLRAQRPLLPRRLFRGATPERRHGMSWTTKFAIAEYFARYRQPLGEENGLVWVGVFAPARLLAYFKDESEYLVNSAGVDVRPWPSPIADTSIRSRRTS